ncbi:phage tail protein [Thermodesulfovibrio yellowstonii]|uniref:phage tail-collar fiber domain-containing protein n=1 Tax=Thermodesulfovibrio yellowstonii TaxID=28262 RepID=UPI0024B37B08|nr:phage tail protein [Thermodesulfovibrio yellowstonii]MDI6865812.1 phage tail protein [Thermodesulfovibrio yellowstonii]
MANFSGTIITNKGLNLLAKAIGGAELVFTRVALGDGVWPQPNSPEQMEELVSEKKSIQIQGIEIVGNGTARIRAVLLNTEIQTGFFARELGVFAQDPDLGEILYAVSYAGEQCDYIPPGGNIVVESILDIFVVVSTAERITAWINDTVVIATKKDIVEHNESLVSHQDIRAIINTHKNSTAEHNIPQQISYAIQNHQHEQYAKKYLHVQSTAALEWDVLHNLGVTYPVIQAYSESTEEILLGGYCGSSVYCGQDGLYCGSSATVVATVLSDIPYSELVIISPNRLFVRFSTAQAGKAIIIGGV